MPPPRLIKSAGFRLSGRLLSLYLKHKILRRKRSEIGDAVLDYAHSLSLYRQVEEVAHDSGVSEGRSSRQCCEMLLDRFLDASTEPISSVGALTTENLEEFCRAVVRELEIVEKLLTAQGTRGNAGRPGATEESPGPAPAALPNRVRSQGIACQQALGLPVPGRDVV